MVVVTSTRLRRAFRPALLRIPQSMRTLKFRLMLLISVVLLVGVGLPVALFVRHLDANYEEFSSTMLEVTTGYVYGQLYDDFMTNDSLAIQRGIEELARDPRIELLRIYGPSGQILFSSHREEVRRNVFELTQNVSFDREDGALEAFSRVDGRYFHHHPLYVRDACTSCHVAGDAPIATLDVVANVSESEQIYGYAKKLSVTGGLLIIAILWIAISLLYEGQIESRLMRIIRGFDALAKGDFTAKVEMSGRHELALLADRFNTTVGHLEEARRREETFYREKLERADRLVTLGEIAAEIAHEVNNPTGIIRTRAEFVREEIEDQDATSPYLEDLDIIVQQTERIADITRSILHYARKQPRSFSETDLGEVVRHSVKVLQPRIKKCGVDVVLDFPEEPARIWGSFSQLEQVCCNLINNSLDAVQGGPARIDVRLRPEAGPGGRALWRLVYRDDGPGIPPALQDKIFSPFFTTKQDGKGTGLGLFIARNIVGNHGGAMTMEHTERGACFVIELESYHG